MSPLNSSYLDELGAAMNASGFEKIASVTIEQGEEIVPSAEEKLRWEAWERNAKNPAPIFFTKEDGTTIQLVNYPDTDKPEKELRYHGRTLFARNTGIFFAHAKHSLLVQLDYDESEVAGDINGYWKLRLYVQFRSVAQIRSTGASIGRVPFLTTRNARIVNRFHLTRTNRENPLRMCYRYDQTQHGETLAPEILAQSITAATDGALPFLQPEPFTATRTEDFPPHFVFPKCEHLFWRKFGGDNLRKVVSAEDTPPKGFPSPQATEKTDSSAVQYV